MSEVRTSTHPAPPVQEAAEIGGTSHEPKGGEEAQTAALQAELAACLAAGVVPDGWQHRISWSADEGSLHLRATALFIGGAALVCLLAWGWKAGLAAAFAAAALRMLLSVRGGPRPGQTITETFIPPDVTLEQLGIAGHKIFEVSSTPAEFSLTRVATAEDSRNVRLGMAATSAAMFAGGALTLLEESGAITPVTYVRTGSLIGAAISVGFAVWIWRQVGQYLSLFDAAEPVDEPSLVDEVLNTATTGSTTKFLSTALLSRLPPRMYRVVVPTLVVLSGALGVLVAFNVTPEKNHLWSGLVAATELIVFVLAGLRGLILLVVSVMDGDWAAFRSALGMAVVMAVLLVLGKLFGLLDEWGAVITWVGNHIG